MRTTTTGKKHITLTLRVPVQEGVRIVSRLWARGILTDSQYISKIEQIDPAQAVIIAQKRLELRQQLSNKGAKNAV